MDMPGPGITCAGSAHGCVAAAIWGDLLDLRGKLVPRNIQDTELASPVVYRQVFEEITGFIPNLSILDLLFCEGQRARSLLAQVVPTA